MKPAYPNSFTINASIRIYARSRLWLLLLASLLVWQSPVYAKAGQKIHILVYGDSLSASYGIGINEGWVTLLSQKLSASADFPDTVFEVSNASIGGETSGGGLARYPETLARVNPDIVILALGANDGLRGYPVKLMRQNLEQIITLSLEQKINVLLCGIQIPFNYGPRYTSLFEQTFAELASKHNIAFLPSLLGTIPLDEQLMQPDRLHPNVRAQGLILDHVYPVLEPLLRSSAKPEQRIESHE